MLQLYADYAEPQPEQASLFEFGAPLDRSPRVPFAVGSCLNHAWLSQELSILFHFMLGSLQACQEDTNCNHAKFGVPQMRFS